MVSYNPVNLSKHKSDTLVVHCCDPRFQQAYKQAAGQVSEFYDLMVVPGASKAIVDDPNVIKNIKMLHGLHNFNEVQIMDHVQCGAFGKVDDEVIDHSKYIQLAENKIRKALPGIKVESRLLGAKQELALIR
jgi:carbonic anhydrase